MRESWGTWILLVLTRQQYLRLLEKQCTYGNSTWVSMCCSLNWYYLVPSKCWWIGVYQRESTSGPGRRYVSNYPGIPGYQKGYLVLPEIMETLASTQCQLVFWVVRDSMPTIWNEETGGRNLNWLLWGQEVKMWEYQCFQQKQQQGCFYLYIKVDHCQAYYLLLLATLETCQWSISGNLISSLIIIKQQLIQSKFIFILGAWGWSLM